MVGPQGWSFSDPDKKKLDISNVGLASLGPLFLIVNFRQFYTSPPSLFFFLPFFFSSFFFLFSFSFFFSFFLFGLTRLIFKKKNIFDKFYFQKGHLARQTATLFFDPGGLRPPNFFSGPRGSPEVPWKADYGINAFESVFLGVSSSTIVGKLNQSSNVRIIQISLSM